MRGALEKFLFKSNICVLRGVYFNETHSADLKVTRAAYTAIKNISNLIKKPLLKSIRGGAIWRKNSCEDRLNILRERDEQRRLPKRIMQGDKEKYRNIWNLWTDITFYNEYARCGWFGYLSSWDF